MFSAMDVSTPFYWKLIAIYWLLFITSKVIFVTGQNRAMYETLSILLYRHPVEVLRKIYICQLNYTNVRFGEWHDSVIYDAK